MKNAMQLKAIVKNIAKEKNVHPQEILQIYMLENMLEKISNSPYKNHFILKGGFLIASLVGVNYRTTMDIDFTISSFPLNHDSIENIFKELCKLTNDDEIKFEYLNTNEIHENNEYEGFRVHLKACYLQLRVDLKIDITAGDLITPNQIQYNYPKLLTNSCISIYAYNIETILSEKLETILSRSTANTRLRDFYDVYTLSKLYETKINKQILKAAIKNTFNKRNNAFLITEYRRICDVLTTNKQMNELWISFQKANNYAKSISWLDVVLEILLLLEKTFNN